MVQELLGRADAARPTIYTRVMRMAGLAMRNPLDRLLSGHEAAT